MSDDGGGGFAAQYTRVLVLKLLVTGGQGFTGQHFVKAARDYGHEVITLQADLRDREAVRQQVLEAAPEAVVHLGCDQLCGTRRCQCFLRCQRDWHAEFAGGFGCPCTAAAQYFDRQQRQCVRKLRAVTHYGRTAAGAGQSLRHEQAGHGVYGQNLSGQAAVVFRAAF